MSRDDLILIGVTAAACVLVLGLVGGFLWWDSKQEPEGPCLHSTTVTTTNFIHSGKVLVPITQTYAVCAQRGQAQP